MTNLCVFINVLGILAVVPVFAGDPPPVIKQFEVDEYNKVIRPYDQVDEKRSEIIVDNVDHLRLECHSSYPVQWIYTGSGIPIMDTDISFSSKLSTTERRTDELNNKYVASVFLRHLREHHSGKYQCSRTTAVTIIPNLYVYVPGQDLFLSPEGKTILINPNVSTTSIPCAVSHPRAHVSLYKFDGDRLTKPITTSDDAIIYDPRKGFRINLKRVEDPEGKYLCTARYNDLVRDVEYILTTKTKSEAPAKYEEFKQLPEEKCTAETCKQCENHSDCPPLMNCYTDNKCRDPCEYSIRCGSGSMCNVVENRPHCYCPPGYVGDPTKECLHIERERYERERYP